MKEYEVKWTYYGSGFGVTEFYKECIHIKANSPDEALMLSADLLIFYMGCNNSCDDDAYSLYYNFSSNVLTIYRRVNDEPVFKYFNPSVYEIREDGERILCEI